MESPTRTEPDFVSRQVTRARRFYFEQAAGKGADLAVVGGGWELMAKDYLINRDTFPWQGVEFVAGGRGVLRINGATHELRRGMFFAYGPGVRHRIETDPNEVLSKYYLNFSGPEAVDRLAAVGMDPGMCRMMNDADEIEDLFESLIDEGAANRPQAAAIVALQLRILFLKIEGGGVSDDPATHRARQTLRRCLAHIDRAFLEVRTVQEVAEACHVSVGHLTRSFLRFGYGSPYRYLTRRKMMHAAALLDSGRLLVREVADRLGLDPFQFSRVFKRVHGISPSEFVRRHGAVRELR